MKRMIAILTVLFCLTALITGCGNSNTGNSTANRSTADSSAAETAPDASPAGDSSTADGSEPAASTGESTYGPKSESILKMLSEGTYTMSIRSTTQVQGQEIVTEMTIAQQKPDYAMEISTAGQMLRIIVQGETKLMIDDIQKTATNLDLIGGAAAFEAPNVAAATTYLGDGTGTVSGKELPYEEYEAGEGATARYYFDGDNLAYMVTNAGGMEVVLEILELTSSVDAGIFSIPDDYTRIESMEDLTAAMTPAA